MNYLVLSCYIVACLILVRNDVSGQMTTFTADLVEISVKGGSTLHDWTAECGEVVEYPSQLTLDIANDGVIEDFGFKVAVSSMDGGRGATMNNKINKALKGEQHPYITFKQTTPSSYLVNDNGQLTLTSSGLISLAGQEQKIDVTVIGEILEDRIVFTASHPMKLSDFDIEPPSAMFGQIKTKNDIFVHLSFTYKKI